MKKTITLILLTGILFSIAIPVNAYDIFYQAIEAPAATVCEYSNNTLSVSYTSMLKDAELIRISTYDAMAELMGSEEKLLASQYRYLSFETKNYCMVSTDNENWYILSRSDTTEGTFTLDYYEDIITPLILAGADMSLCAESGSFYVKVVTASENHTEGNDAAVFTYKESETASFTGDKFAFIHFVLPEDAVFEPDALTVTSQPLSESIRLFPTEGENINTYIPSRKGYTFDGWSYDGENRTGIIPADVRAITLTSHWQPIKYEINYVLSTKFGYGFGKADLSDMPTVHMTGTPTPIYDIVSPVPGYIFDGWYQDIEFTGEKITEIPADHAGSSVLYAKWTSADELAQALKERREAYIKEKKFGDLDDDGLITAADARLILRASVGLENPDASVLKRADYNNSGKISAINARTTLRVSVGLDSLYNILLNNGMLDSVK